MDLNTNLPSISLHAWHNASIAVYYNDQIISVIEFERFINKKNASYIFFEPIHSKDVILKDIYDYLKYEFGFTKYDKFIIGEGYQQFPEEFKSVIPANEYIIDYSHHFSHAYSSFAQSPFNEAIIVSFDGGGCDGYFNVFTGKKGEDLVKIDYFDYDLGSHYHLLGSVCEDIKNYHVLTAAGKVLGLQSYGKVIDEWKKPLYEFFKTRPPYYKDLNEKIKLLSDQIGIDFSQQNMLLGENAYDFCKTGQQVFEDIFFELVDNHILNNDLPIVIAGGCALNIVLNTKVKEKYNREVFVAPNSTDCGLSVGFLCKHFKPLNVIDVTYKGVGVLDKFTLMEYHNSRFGRIGTIEEMVNDLVNEKIIGVVQGNSEHGPRALGNRSIICSPIPKDMKDTLNFKVKHREWFRPFAPIVRLEDVNEYFEWEGESRWMNFCPLVKEEYREFLPAITHVDGTARVQTITREQNEFIYDLLTEFKSKTGIGVLVNTSFNVDGKPILSTYNDAFKVLDNTQLDALYLDGYYFKK